MFLTEKQMRNKYNRGVILENRQNRKFVIIFQLCSLHFSSTKKRAKKGKHYRLDNPFWTVFKGGLFTKLKMILTGRVFRVKYVRTRK